MACTIWTDVLQSQNFFVATFAAASPELGLALVWDAEIACELSTKSLPVETWTSEVTCKHWFKVCQSLFRYCPRFQPLAYILVRMSLNPLYGLNMTWVFCSFSVTEIPAFQRFVLGSSGWPCARRPRRFR
jgi:hypothetical protein